MIERASLKDIDEIVSIENECFAHPWTKDEFIEALGFDWCKIFVYREDDKIIGYLDIAYSLDFLELYNIAVKKELQGKGYGQKMLDFLFEEAKRVNAKKIFLEVRSGNKAYDLYLKNGFKESRIRKNYYPDGDGIDMVKELHD